MDSIMLIVVMLAVFYFLIIRPENKRKKDAENMRNSIKKGERITTIGGMVGRVVQMNDTTVVFETSDDRVRIEIAKWGIQSTESMERAAAQKGNKKLFQKDAAPSEEPKSEDATQAPKAEEPKIEAPEKAPAEEKTSYDPEIK